MECLIGLVACGDAEFENLGDGAGVETVYKAVCDLRGLIDLVVVDVLAITGQIAVVC